MRAPRLSFVLTAVISATVLFLGATSAAQAPTAPLWVARYDGPGHYVDGATALGLSPDGSTVFVTGASYGHTTNAYATVAYAVTTGTVLWGARYKETRNGNDAASALAVSPDGSTVFVTGSSWGGTGKRNDYGTVAYDAASGARLWVARYDRSSDDFATDLGISPDGSTVFVTGSSRGSGTDDDFATVAYDAGTGDQRWEAVYNGPADFEDPADALRVSPDGSTVFVAGSSWGSGTFSDYAIVAYDASAGTELWVARYNGPEYGHDYAYDLAVSPDGSSVFVTGQSYGPGVDYATAAYDAATGAGRWVARYNGPGDSLDAAEDVEVSPDGSTVFVTGSSPSSGGVDAQDYATIAYDATTGAGKWIRRYNGAGNGNDVSRAMAVSPDGSKVFVTGESQGFGVGPDYATIGYETATGARVFVGRYAGGAYNFGRAVRVSLDGAMVFVTGSSNEDFATLAYSPV